MKEFTIYELDTNGIDLSTGVEEQKEIELERIMEKTKTKLTLNRETKKTIRQRWKAASRVVKAAAILGILTVGTTTAYAATKVLQYIPNQGIIQAAHMQTLQVPITSYGNAGFYLRISNISYDGTTLKLVAETNWTDVVIDTKEKEEQIEASFMSHRGIGLMQGEDWIPTVRTEESYESKSTKVTSEYKVSTLENMCLVLNALVWNEETKEYTYQEGAVQISVEKLPFVDAKEITSVGELGQKAESEGIQLVGISNHKGGVQTIDLQQEDNTEALKVSGINEYTLTEKSGTTVTLLNERGENGGFKYLLFRSNRPFEGDLTVSSVLVEKEINHQLQVALPRLGECSNSDQVIDCDGVSVRTTSVNVSEVEDTSEEKQYLVQVECKLEQENTSKFELTEQSFINAMVTYKGKESGETAHSAGVTTISLVISKKEYEENSTLSIDLKSLCNLSKKGNWEFHFE